LLLGPIVPLLFQGEEWGAGTPFPFFADHEDPALAKAVREGRRREFGAFDRSENEVPDPGAFETFERAKLDWSERSRSPHAELLDWHRRLIRARRSIASLAAGPVPQVDCDIGAGWIIVRRSGAVLVANLGPQSVAVPLADAKALSVELASRPDVTFDDATVTLPPMSVVLLVESR
jgi:maltooligosyltrehalose trehalohydrolase